MGEPRLWTGGRIFTGHRYAESLLVDDGVVVAVGADPDVRRLAPSGTDVAALHGRLVLPGLIDAHLHLGELARSRAGLDLSSARDLDDMIARIREWAGAHPTGTVVGRGLDIERSLGGRWPLGADLDRAVDDRPLVVYHASGHAAIANTVALSAAEVESRAVEELRDRVGRSPDGRPNGVVFEEAVRWLAPLAATPVGPDDLVRTLEHLALLGLTTVASMNVSVDELTGLRSLASDQRLPLRVRAYVRLLRLGEYAPSDLAPVGVPGRFAVVGAKGFTDGAFGPRTAWLSEPYADAPDRSGIPVESDESLSEALAAADALGLAPALHAIGDRAVVRATRLLAPYIGRRGAPSRIEHLGLVPPAVLSVLGEVRPALVVQPGFVWSDFWLPERLGPARVRWAYPFRTLADRGHRLVGSSDAPYDPVDPWRGLRAAVERCDAQGRSANPNVREALAVEEAARMYTVHAGGALGEPTLGSLEVGSKADLVIVEATGLGAALRAGAASVRETWLDGRRVYAFGDTRPGQ
ncbi:MAG TPA: amidohydrolase [Thermoplasmata archaeon]|nr:amidohydrolase [Thermoplasmata archaeon]